MLNPSQVNRPGVDFTSPVPGVVVLPPKPNPLMHQKLSSDMLKLIKPIYHNTLVVPDTSIEVLCGITPQVEELFVKIGCTSIKSLAALPEVNPKAYRELSAQVNQLEELVFNAVMLLSALVQ